MSSVVVRADLWEAVVVGILGIGLGHLLRAAHAAIRDERDVGAAVRGVLRRGRPVMTSLAGIALAVVVLLFLEGLLAALALGLALDGLDGEVDGGLGGWMLAALVGMAVVGIALVALVVRLLRTTGRSLRTARADRRAHGRPGLTPGRVGVWVVASNVVAGYVAVVGLAPAWEGAPSSCPQQITGSGAVFAYEAQPTRAPLELPDGPVGEVASRLGILPPVRLSGMGDGFVTEHHDDGGASLVVRRGSNLPFDELEPRFRAAIESAGATVVGSSSTGGSFGSDFSLHWVRDGQEGTVTGRTCSGFHRPSEIVSRVQVGPGRLGACAASPRFRICDAIYAAAARLVQGSRLVELPHDRGVHTDAIHLLAAITEEPDGRLLLQQPTLAIDRIAPPWDTPAGAIVADLVEEGWEAPPPLPRDPSDDVRIDDWLPTGAGRPTGPEQVELHRTVEGTALTLTATLDGGSTTFAISTDAPVPR
jgi:hypothetical protein